MVSFVQSPLKKNYFGLTFRIIRSVHRTYSVEGGLYPFHFNRRKSPSSVAKSPAILNNKYFALKKSANYFLCLIVFFKNIQIVNFLTPQIIIKM